MFQIFKEEVFDLLESVVCDVSRCKCIQESWLLLVTYFCVAYLEKDQEA